MEFEDVLAKVGNFGRYQKQLVFAFLIPSTILAPLFTMNQMFYVSVPDHWCNVPELLPFNLTVKQEQSLVRSKKDPLCSMYDVNYTSLLLTSDNWTIPANTTTKSCDHGWIYDKTHYDSTAASQWNMVCKHSHYASFVLMMGRVGGACLTPIYGLLSDRYGRKITFFLVIFITCLTSLASVLVTNFTVFIVLRTISGGALPFIFQIPYIMLTEIVGPDMRTRINGLGQTCFTAGMCLLPLLAWLTRDWVTLGLITSSIMVLFIFFWPVVPESARWLLSKEKYDETTKIMSKIAKKNGKQINPDEILNDLRKLGEHIKKKKDFEEEERKSFWKYPRLRKNFLIITYIWLAASAAYHGLQINGYNLAGNEFITFFLLSIAEAPGCFCSWIFMDKIGRRWCSVSGLVLIGLACLVPVAYPEYGVAASFVGKLAAKWAFLALYQQSSELYPTAVRGFGIGLSSSFAAVITIAVPYIAYLNKYGEWIPFVIFAFPALTSSFFASFLPETLNANLPQTIEDSEKFGLDQKFFSCNKKRTPSLSHQENSIPAFSNEAFVKEEEITWTKL